MTKKSSKKEKSSHKRERRSKDYESESRKKSKHHSHSEENSSKINSSYFDDMFVLDSKNGVSLGSELKLDGKNESVAPISVENVSKWDFFSMLQKSESLQPKVGSVHAKPKHTPSSITSTVSKESQDWICPKCSTSNPKYSIECSRCRAIKRLSEFR